MVDCRRAQGRLEPRCIEVLDNTDATRFDFQAVRQVFRIRRRSECKHPPRASVETVNGITSVLAARADARQLLAWNRGHWTVEANHDVRDRTLGEDVCLTRTNIGHCVIIGC